MNEDTKESWHITWFNVTDVKSFVEIWQNLDHKAWQNVTDVSWVEIRKNTDNIAWLNVTNVSWMEVLIDCNWCVLMTGNPKHLHIQP